MAYGPGVNEVNYTDLPPTGDTIASAAQKTQNQFDALYTGLNADIVRASAAEVNTAEDTTKLVTPGTLLKGKASGVASLNESGKVTGTELPNASETVKGVVELATNAEVITGTDTERAVTPAGLLAGFPTRLRSNLLGTVSQSGGVPTGAIIESGSNANGRYVKFADGTMICTQFISLANNGLSFEKNNNSSNWWALKTFTFPAAFITDPKGLSASVKNDTGLGWASVRYGDIYTIQISIYDDSDRSGQPITCSYAAIGRWF